MSGYDAYILSNNSVSFSYKNQNTEGEVIVEVANAELPEPVEQLIGFGSVSDVFFIVFDDAIYSVGFCEGGLCQLNIGPQSEWITIYLPIGLSGIQAAMFSINAITIIGTDNFVYTLADNGRVKPSALCQESGITSGVWINLYQI